MKTIDLKRSIITHSFKLIGILIILVVVLKNISNKTEDSLIRQSIVPIAMKLSKSTYTPTLKISGFTKPMESGILKSNFKAIVASIPIKQGRFVNKGDLILKLSSPEIEKRLIEAKSHYAHKLAEFESSKKLMKKSFKSENNYLASKAELDEAQTNLQKAETDANELNVVAINDGYLEECYVQVGQTVFPQDKIINVVYKGHVQVRSYVSEAIINNLHIGMKARVKIADREYAAEISGLSSVADQQTRNFYIDLTIAELNTAYGVSCDVTLLLPQTQGFWINASALTLNDEGVIGVKIIKDNKVAFLPIKLTSMTEQGAYIECDMNELSLITYGGEFLLSGQTPTISWQKSPTL